MTGLTRHGAFVTKNGEPPGWKSPGGPADATVDYRTVAPGQTLLADLPPAASGRRPQQGVAELLRRRLLIVVGVCTVFFGILPLFSLPMLLSRSATWQSQLLMVSQYLMTFVILVAGIAVRRCRTAGALRIAEAVILWVVTAHEVLINAYMIGSYGWMALPEGQVGHPYVTAAGTRLDPVSIRWFALIVAYGALIPNTLQRCAIMVGSVTVTALGALVVQGVVQGVAPAALAAILLYPAVWLVMAAVIAVFGSYRLNVLERQVAEARKLGQYRLQRLISAGGMGEVYLAEHVLLKQPCAVKVIKPEQAGDPTALRRFEREVQATARLRHWNIVQIFDYGTADDGTFYYAMEYLPGPSLETLVRSRGPLPPARALFLLRQVCAALREAHGAGLIHRDIKPGNVIACRLGANADVVKLLDFGLARPMTPGLPDDRLTQEGLVTGTPTYMSPEQATGQPRLDERSDIYSVGAVAYFLVTGRPPFTRPLAVQLILAHVQDEVPRPSQFNPELPADLESVILRCMEKDPADRFTTATDLDSALATCACAGAWTPADATAWWADYDNNNHNPAA